MRLVRVIPLHLMMQGVDKVYEKSASAAKSFEIFPL